MKLFKKMKVIPWSELVNEIGIQQADVESWLLVIIKGLVPTEHGGILWNLRGPMCKKHQITYRYFMFTWLKVKKSPGGLKKPHNNHGGKIWFSLVKNVNISRQLSSDWLKMWHSPWIFFCNSSPWCYEILALFSYIMGSKYGFYKIILIL